MKRKFSKILGVGLTLALLISLLLTAAPVAAQTIDLTVNDQEPWEDGAFTFENILPGGDPMAFNFKLHNVGDEPGILTFSMSYVENDIAGAPAPNMSADEFASLIYVEAVHYLYRCPADEYEGSLQDDLVPDAWLLMDAGGNNDGYVSLYEICQAGTIPYDPVGDPFVATAEITYFIEFQLGDSLEGGVAGGAIQPGGAVNDSQGDGISVTVSATLGTDVEESSGNVFQAAGTAGPVLNVTTDATYGTIQAAIDDASPNDTINVSAGTYAEDIVIDKPLVLEGANAGIPATGIRGPESVIDAQLAVAAVLIEGVPAVTFDGFTVTGFSKGGIVAKDVLAVQVEGNIVSTTDHSQAPNGIQVGYVMDPTATTGTVKDNQVSGCSWEGYDPTKSYEYWEEGEGGFINWSGSGILVIAPNSELTISGNEVHSCDVGMDIETSPLTLITNNDVHDNSYGIVSWNAAPIINFNDIYQNALVGVYRTTEGSLDGLLNAKVNYWGDISGPECEVAFDGYPINPGGTGDSVSDYVHYLPWLTRDFETVLADEIAYLGSPMVYLETGWNTFSTPIALDPGCDTWAKYVALGDGLAIHATSPAYAFDGAIQDWRPLIDEDANYRLKPCDAIYVRMTEPDIAAILYSPDLSVPSKDLYAGWNLVSLAYLPEGPVSGMSVVEALDTVYTVTGDLTGYDLVVSPPVNGEQWFFTRDSEQEEGPPIEAWLKDYLQEVLEEWSQSESGMPFEVWLISEYGQIFNFLQNDLYNWLMDDCAVWGFSHGIDDMETFMGMMCDDLVDDAISELMAYLMENWVGAQGSLPLHECFSQYIMEGRMQITQGYWVFMKNPGTLAGFSMTPIPFGMP